MSPLHSSCPDCGAPLPADSPQSLCPACLLRQALASRTVVAGQESTPPPPPPAPEEIADKFPQFEVTECLGSGGMGVVYKARQKSLDRWVAIKILRPEKTGEEQFAERFAREAQTLARLNHPNIVTVFDYGETGGLFYIVMEFVDGVNLRDLLREGKLEPEQALAIVPPICEALQYAHEKGIVHRDIKPENLLLDRDGRIKIADFGIASLVGARGEASGTPPYMAPEQQEPSTVDHRADIYALGVVLYEMLTGERPAKDLVAPSRKVPMDVRLDQMVMRALDQNPDRRYQTAEEFRTVLETAGAPAPSVPPPVVPAPPPPMPTAAPAKRGAFARLWWLFLVMLPVGALLGLGVGSVLLSLIPKKYEAKSIVQIRLKPIDPGPRSLVTWVEALKSEKAMNEVATRLNLTKAWMTTDEQVAATLKGIVRTQEIRGTSLLEVSVRFTDPVTAVAIANTTAEVFQERAKDSPGTDSVIIHERAIEPLAPVSPNGRLMLFAAAGIGLAISPIIALVLILAVGRGGSRGCLILGLLISFGAVTASGIWFATRKRTIPPPRSVSTSAAKTPPVRLMATLRIIDMPQERNFPPFKEAMEPDMRVVAVLRTVVETGSEAEMPIPFIPGRDISGGRLPREGSLMISPRLKDGIVSYHLGGIEKSDGSITKRTDLGNYQFPLGKQGFFDNWGETPGRKQVALLSFETTESAPGLQPAATGGYSYGPVIEREVSDWNQSPTNCLIDFDTGKLFSIAADSGLILLSQENPDWDSYLEKEIRPISDGAIVTDAFGLAHGDGHERKPGLVGTHLLTAPYTWKSKDAALLMDAINPKEQDDKRKQPALIAVPFPSYFEAQDDVASAFCTSEGRRGLLQVIGLNDDRKGVKIRYKLVEEPSVGWDGETRLQVRTFSVPEEVLLPAGLAPKGDHEVRIKGFPDDLPFNYSILVYSTKGKMEPIYTLPEAGGYLRYSAAKDQCPVYWHRSGEFVIITNRGTQRSSEIYLLAVSGDKAERVALPDFVANALGRIDATRTYRGSMASGLRWTGDDLHFELGLDTLKGYFTCQVVLELQHGPHTVPKVILKSCTTPLAPEK